jgi:hypothetical protein
VKMSLSAISGLAGALQSSPLGQIGSRVTNKLLGWLGLRKGGKVRKVRKTVGKSQHDKVPVHIHKNEVVLSPTQAVKYERLMKKAGRRIKK